MDQTIEVNISPEQFTAEMSKRCLNPISAEEASLLLRDPELIEESIRTGIDLGMLVGNLQLTVDERWRHHQSALKGILAFSEAGRRARAKDDRP